MNVATELNHATPSRFTNQGSHLGRCVYTTRFTRRRFNTDCKLLRNPRFSLPEGLLSPDSSTPGSSFISASRRRLGPKMSLAMSASALRCGGRCFCSPLPFKKHPVWTSGVTGDHGCTATSLFLRRVCERVRGLSRSTNPPSSSESGSDRRRLFRSTGCTSHTSPVSRFLTESPAMSLSFSRSSAWIRARSCKRSSSRSRATASKAVACSRSRCSISRATFSFTPCSSAISVTSDLMASCCRSTSAFDSTTACLSSPSCFVR
mmetsp:Transcript_36868/g.85715  ORF Transcript_36868/g.85715 Transcript_36868/m.85715 type:complete len:262 (-) Transcript_36868:204-989(-)